VIRSDKSKINLLVNDFYNTMLALIVNNNAIKTRGIQFQCLTGMGRRFEIKQCPS